jgi:hypothetical protein
MRRRRKCGVLRVLKQLSKLWLRRRVATAEEFREFLTREAVYLSQKATIDYCRARAGVGWQKLVSEPTFLAALESCRWQAMAAVLGDQMVVAEGYLRPYAGQNPRPLGGALAAMFQTILETSPAPTDTHAHWRSLATELAARLGRAQLAEVHQAGEVARTSGARIFELLPIHPSVRRYDREIVINSVRFGMVAFSEALARAADQPAALVERLIAAAPPAP